MAESTPDQPSEPTGTQPPLTGEELSTAEPEKNFAVGDRVRLIAQPPYVKTAERMPMLRPPNVISLGEEGTVLNRHPGQYWSVRFDRGAFLLEGQYLERVVGGDRPGL
ncbi:MAG: DUF3148 domain-containing protein [Synechococcales bacterium]|nr:DUF3148 domain-containing protein [Synechococcales bacterium]